MGFRDDILSGDWLDGKEREEYKDFMAEDEDDKEVDTLIRKATSTGRPLGTERFIKKLEKVLDRGLLPKKAGRPGKKKRV